MNNTFVERFDEVAERRAAHPAIEFDGRESWTYQELKDRSQAVAGGIVSARTAEERIVAIGLPKSPDYIASLIGIWRAGCAALPLPPQTPHRRQQSHFRRARAAALITSESRSTGCVEIDPKIDADVELDRLPAGADDLAYVFFTSGSTGRPKAVAVEHRGLIPMLDAQISAFEIDESTRSLFYLSTAFDASLSDIGTVLIAGGTLVIDSDIDSLTVHGLMKRIESRGISYADLPPAVMTHAAKQRLSAPRSLRTVVVGGEVCPRETVSWWAARLRLVNVYGPTEATVCTSLNVCDPALSQAPSIGQPITGMEYRIEANDRSDPSTGELWISGPGLARGYLDDDTLTAEKFVTFQGKRWYRTGDRVQLDGEGRYIFRGRMDRQFKLQGRLIEPGEIEEQMLELAEIGEAVVVPITHSPGTDSTATLPVGVGAILRPGRERKIDVSAVRRQLAQRLPPWMVPQHFRIVDKIPLTESGKPDLQHIAELFAAGTDSNSAPPDHPGAARLRSIWENAIGRGEIHWDDDFYLVGGDSLSAMQVLAHAESAGIRLSLDQLQQCRTLRKCLEVWKSPRASSSGGMTTTELNHQVKKLIDGIERRGVPRPRPGSKTLITGATGFLGTWALQQLLSSASQAVVCLVRASNPDHALRRINDARRRFLGEHVAMLDGREIEIACGDVSREFWGLEQESWDRLAGEVSIVMHVAAEVHLLKSFDALRPTNLDALAWAIRFVHQGIAKSLHYASTLSVFVGTDRRDRCFYERDRLEQESTVFGGYAQTKWAAEKLLWSLGDRFPLGVYRFGLLVGDSNRGIGPQSDQLTLFTRGLARLGVFPRDCDDLRFDFTPVDDAARVFCERVLDEARGAFHVCGQRSITLAEWIGAMRHAGIQLEKVPLDQFLLAAGREMEGGLDAEIAAVCLSLARRVASKRLPSQRELDLFLATDTLFDASRTSRHLRHRAVSRVSVDDHMLTRMVEAMFPLLAGQCR